MGSRDFRHREAKKAKKKDKVPPPINILPKAPSEVEVIGKKHKKEAEED